MKFKKLAIATVAVTMLVTTLAVPASAATYSGTLYEQNTSAVFSSGSNKYTSGSCYVSNGSSSNDGVNMYLDYSSDRSSWTNAKHIFAEPGASATSGNSNPGSRYWRGVINSFYPNGKNCYASGSIYLLK